MSKRKKKNHRLIPWQNSVKVKKYPQKIRQFQSVPAASTVGPCSTIIDLLLRLYDGVQTEWQLCRPLSHRFLRSRLISFCNVCPDELSKNLGSLLLEILKLKLGVASVEQMEIYTDTQKCEAVNVALSPWIILFCSVC